MSNPLLKNGWLLLCPALLACGATPKREVAVQQSPVKRRVAPAMEADAAIGGMDESAVRRVATRALADAQDCIATGRARLPELDGDVEVSLEVNRQGEVARGHIRRSTLGDYVTDQCIMSAFSKRQWPRPVGGRIGLVKQSFGFEAGERAQQWSAEELKQRMNAVAPAGDGFAELTNALQECREEAGAKSMMVTIYVDDDGLAQAVGLSSPDMDLNDAAGCVDTTIRTTSFPSSEQRLAKVTVSL